MFSTVQVIGFTAGMTLATAEFTSVIMLLFARRYMERKFPRLTLHLALASKTTSWRICAGIDTFLLTFLLTGNAAVAGSVIGFEVLTKFGFFYSHEWVWNRPTFKRFMEVSRSDTFKMNYAAYSKTRS